MIYQLLPNIHFIYRLTLCIFAFLSAAFAQTARSSELKSVYLGQSIEVSPDFIFALQNAVRAHDTSSEEKIIVWVQAPSANMSPKEQFNSFFQAHEAESDLRTDRYIYLGYVVGEGGFLEPGFTMEHFFTGSIRNKILDPFHRTNLSIESRIASALLETFRAIKSPVLELKSTSAFQRWEAQPNSARVSSTTLLLIGALGLLAVALSLTFLVAREFHISSEKVRRLSPVFLLEIFFQSLSQQEDLMNGTGGQW